MLKLAMLYADTDTDLVRELLTHLSIYGRRFNLKAVSYLDDRAAPVVVVAESASLYAERQAEVCDLLERRRTSEILVVPVRFRRVPEDASPFEGAQFLPRGGPAVGEIATRALRDNAWADVARETFALCRSVARVLPAVRS